MAKKIRRLWQLVLDPMEPIALSSDLRVPFRHCRAWCLVDCSFPPHSPAATLATPSSWLADFFL